MASEKGNAENLRLAEKLSKKSELTQEDIDEFSKEIKIEATKRFLDEAS